MLISKIQNNNLEFKFQLSSQITSLNLNLKLQNSNTKFQIQRQIFKIKMSIFRLNIFFELKY
jgi:hypothetical protein